MTLIYGNNYTRHLNIIFTKHEVMIMLLGIQYYFILCWKTFIKKKKYKKQLRKYKNEKENNFLGLEIYNQFY